MDRITRTDDCSLCTQYDSAFRHLFATIDTFVLFTPAGFASFSTVAPKSIRFLLFTIPDVDIRGIVELSTTPD